MAKGLGVAEFCMRLESQVELAAEVCVLGGEGGTSGLEVVWWQKVEPVGLICGGNLER